MADEQYDIFNFGGSSKIKLKLNAPRPDQRGGRASYSITSSSTAEQAASGSSYSEDHSPGSSDSEDDVGRPRRHRR